jgi:hypothetical protein
MDMVEAVVAVAIIEVAIIGGHHRGRNNFGGQQYWQPGEDKEYSNEEWNHISHG